MVVVSARTPAPRSCRSAVLAALCATIVAATAMGCGGRGGYEADRAVPTIQDRLRDVQRTQHEAARQGGRIEMRVYELQTKVAQLLEEVRQLRGQSGASRQPATTPSPSAAPP